MATTARAAQLRAGQHNVFALHFRRDQLVLVVDQVLAVDQAVVALQHHGEPAHRLGVAGLTGLAEGDERDLLAHEIRGLDVVLDRVPVLGGDGVGRERGTRQLRNGLRRHPLDDELALTAECGARDIRAAEHVEERLILSSTPITVLSHFVDSLSGLKARKAICPCPGPRSPSHEKSFCATYEK